LDIKIPMAGCCRLWNCGPHFSQFTCVNRWLFLYPAHKCLDMKCKIGQEWNYFTNTSYLSYTEQSSWDPKSPVPAQESSYPKVHFYTQNSLLVDLIFSHIDLILTLKINFFLIHFNIILLQDFTVHHMQFLWVVHLGCDAA
jgi:hypothetical protein